MVKSPRTRHSKSRKKPVTIDLESEPVEKDSSDPEQQAGEPDVVSDTSPIEPPESKEAPAEDTPPEAADGDHAPETEQSASPEQQPVRTAGRPSLILSGLIGAVIALLAGGALQWAGIFPAPSAQQPASVAVDNSATDALRKQLAELSDNVSALQSAKPPAAGIGQQQFQAALDEIEQKIAGLKTAPATVGKTDTAALEAVNGRIDAIETALHSVEEKATAAQSSAENQSGSSGALADRLAAIEAEVLELDRKSTVSAGQPRIARAIAAAALKSAIDRGDPFMSELETYASVADGGEEVAALRNLAASGVPTEADIADLFTEAAGAMIVASRPVPEDAGMVERLMASARSLVDVRPVGDVKGDDAPAIIARMEVALKKGDLQAVISEYEKLPEAVRAAGGDLIEKVRARMQANDLVDRTLSGALTGSKE